MLTVCQIAFEKYILKDTLAVVSMILVRNKLTQISSLTRNLKCKSETGLHYSTKANQLLQRYHQQLLD